jgi:hypothetical protein
VSDDANYIKKIESEEINKIINLIYDAKPEEIIVDDLKNKKHLEIIDYVDSLEKPKISFWKRKKV